MVEKYGRKIVVGVDARDGKVATHGWLETTDVDSFDFCASLRDRGVGTVIYTDIARDGGLQGTNLDAYRRLSTIEGLDVVASGGITELSELSELNAIGVAGDILGKALYTGRLNLRDAVSLMEKEG
jgi:phosphoribosylformimino-5-aminoimidazole carboxamide ribotide isomerase